MADSSREDAVMCDVGVKGGLYYVRDGTVNEYALTFNLLLRTYVTDIYFHWNASAADQLPVGEPCR